MKKWLFIVLIIGLLMNGNRFSTIRAEEFNITIRSGEDMIVNCPKTAKAGEEVEIETMSVTDATLTISVKDPRNGEELGGYLAEGRYTFIMPEDDVIVDANLVFDQPGA